MRHKKLWQTTTMSFVSEPVCMPHCPAVETWFQGSESLLRISFWSGTQSGLTEGSSVTVWSAVWNAGRWNHVCFDSICPCIHLRLSKCLSVCLSYSLCLFSQDFLTALICRKTHEYMQPLWNLMDLEWTWDVATWDIIRKFGCIWKKLPWSHNFLGLTVQILMCWNN